MFKCGVHDFETENLEEWDEHAATVKHEYTYVGECVACGKDGTYRYTGLHARGKPHRGVCQDCKADLVKDNA